MRATQVRSTGVERKFGNDEIIVTKTTQTRLLALNATIEAARAGDAGRGEVVGFVTRARQD